MAFVAALTITLAALRWSDHDVVVTVDDGIEVVTENLSTTYRVRVANNTDQRLDQLEVTLTTPSPLVLGPAGSGPAQAPTETKWLVDVAEGATAQVELGVVVGTVSAGTDITVIACASAAGRSVACGADVNRGATAVKDESGAPLLVTLMMWWQLLLAAPVALLVVFAVCRPRRRGNEARGRRESS
ncbi:hypothetical protein FXN61_07920 [Lentzea sp. PSKA42]|uniref:DUF11 domain-containing protein n=1 Tax=Lentzea indica TaxID=2604800 RepID=A0ABX1FCR9_9PSEU|nr:hypothetical protein [Lentzea indica]NKE56763.1 hypothetical protein [Lentzea indica]